VQAPLQPAVGAPVGEAAGEVAGKVAEMSPCQCARVVMRSTGQAITISFAVLYVAFV